MNQNPVLVDDDSAVRSRAILVVDDEPAFRAVVCEILRSYGFTAHQASNAKLAIAILENTTPDLILTDVMMPGIDGLTLIRQLRSQPCWANIPTVVLSAKASPEDQEAALQAGANGCLIKPFTAQDLIQTVDAYIHHA